MIQSLWNRHYIAGVTGTYHGDMALAFGKMLKDSDCDQKTARQLRGAIAVHAAIERSHKELGEQFTILLRKIEHGCTDANCKQCDTPRMQTRRVYVDSGNNVIAICPPRG